MADVAVELRAGLAAVAGELAVVGLGFDEADETLGWAASALLNAARSDAGHRTPRAAKR